MYKQIIPTQEASNNNLAAHANLAKLNVNNFVLYYSDDDYKQMGCDGVIDDVFRNIEIIRKLYNKEFKDLIKTDIGQNTTKIELIME
tara:strand:- start:4796 stop:5056 length:261 start_codon:yes stop_codon:yes gene_type:complete